MMELHIPVVCKSVSQFLVLVGQCELASQQMQERNLRLCLYQWKDELKVDRLVCLFRCWPVFSAPCLATKRNFCLLNTQSCMFPDTARLLWLRFSVQEQA